MEEQPVDDVDDDSIGNNIDVNDSDGTTANDDNTKQDPMEEDANDKTNGDNNDDEVNQVNSPKELQDTLGSYWEEPTGQRVACVY